MPTIWRVIPGTGMKIGITISGRITDRQMVTIPHYIGKSGYPLIDLKINGELVTKRIDKLVARLWLGREKGKKYLIHLDHNKANCNEANLVWATRKEFKNYKKAPANNSTGKKGKRVLVYDTHSKKETTYNSPKEAASALGMQASKLRATIRSGGKLNNFKLSYL